MAHQFQSPALRKIRPTYVGQRFKFISALFGKTQHEYTEDYEVPLPDHHDNHDANTVVIKKGSVTDGASFPPFLSAVFSAIAIYALAGHPFWLMFALWAISRSMNVIFDSHGLSDISGYVHDELYRNHCLQMKDGSRTYEGCTRYQADDLFKRLHVFTNDMYLIAFGTYAGLVSGSWLTWRNYRKKKKIDLKRDK